MTLNKIIDMYCTWFLEWNKYIDFLKEETSETRIVISEQITEVLLYFKSKYIASGNWMFRTRKTFYMFLKHEVF